MEMFREDTHRYCPKTIVEMGRRQRAGMEHRSECIESLFLTCSVEQEGRLLRHTHVSNNDWMDGQSYNRTIPGLVGQRVRCCYVSGKGEVSRHIALLVKTESIRVITLHIKTKSHIGWPIDG